MLSPSTFYHIYNCANGHENLIREDENHRFFLLKWRKFIEPIADTYCYCLMPNHFHFLIKMKPQEEVETTFGKFETFQKLEYRYSKQFANFFSSYIQAYNKMYARRGSLFNPNFKKKEIESDEYFTRVIQYIHQNPVHHGFTSQIDDWPHSSYHSILSPQKTRLKRDEILSWFGSKQHFIESQQLSLASYLQLEKELTT